MRCPIPSGTGDDYHSSKKIMRYNLGLKLKKETNATVLRPMSKSRNHKWESNTQVTAVERGANKTK